MKFCEDPRHSKIIYNEWDCPLCRTIDMLEKAKRTLDEKNYEIEEEIKKFKRANSKSVKYIEELERKIWKEYKI